MTADPSSRPAEAAPRGRCGHCGAFAILNLDFLCEGCRPAAAPVPLCPRPSDESLRDMPDAYWQARQMLDGPIDDFSAPTWHAALYDAIRAWESERSALAVDVERLNWLDADDSLDVCRADNGWIVERIIRGRRGEPGDRWKPIGRGKTLREAIDAARAEQEGTPT